MVKNSADPPSDPYRHRADCESDEITSSVVEEQTITQSENGGVLETRSVRKVQQSDDDRNLDGIPDKLESFLTNSDFRLDWTRRRQLVYRIVVGMAFLYTVLITAMVYMMIFGKPLDGNLEGLISTALWTLSTTFVAITMSYIFGAQIDASSYRSSVNDIIGKLSAARRPSGE